MTNKIWIEIIEWIKTVAVVLICFFIFNSFFMATSVRGSSMYPNINEGDILILYRLGKLERGDTVSFRSGIPFTESERASFNIIQKALIGQDETKYLVKRIIAGPGERVKIVAGKVYVDGNLLEENYLQNTLNEDMEEIIVPEDYFFLMGDNRPISYDSRHIGVVHKSNIFGRVVLRLWPIGSFKLFD